MDNRNASPDRARLMLHLAGQLIEQANRDLDALAEGRERVRELAPHALADVEDAEAYVRGDSA